MEHEINAIEWALKAAREELKRTGKTYREFGPWDNDPTGEKRRGIYERDCDKLREVIAGLEAALFTVSFDVHQEAA